jgi:hypothetical protein
MITERSQAYGRIMRTLSACEARGAVHEVARLRETCSTLVFASQASPRERQALTDSIVAVADLVARRTITSELAAAVVDDIFRCAPHDPAHP